MSLSDIWLRLRALLFRRRVEREMWEELDFHLEKETRKNIDRGMGAEEAARRARAKFGSPDRIADACRDARGLHLVNGLRQDVRHALRTSTRKPGLTVTAIVVLAFGVGADATMFSLVNELMLRAPAHVVEPERLVQLHSVVSHRSSAAASWASYGRPNAKASVARCRSCTT